MCHAASKAEYQPRKRPNSQLVAYLYQFHEIIADECEQNPPPPPARRRRLLTVFCLCAKIYVEVLATIYEAHIIRYRYPYRSYRYMPRCTQYGILRLTVCILDSVVAFPAYPLKEASLLFPLEKGSSLLS